MTSLRRVREDLRALRDTMADDVQRRFVWVDYKPGESEAEAIKRTLSERGLKGDEPGLQLFSWKPPD